MTKHNTARSRTSLNITQQSYQFFNQILEILSSQNGILIIDIWNSALEIQNLVNVCLKTSEQLLTLQSLVSALLKSIELIPLNRTKSNTEIFVSSIIEQMLHNLRTEPFEFVR